HLGTTRVPYLLSDSPDGGEPAGRGLPGRSEVAGGVDRAPRERPAGGKAGVVPAPAPDGDRRVVGIQREGAEDARAGEAKAMVGDRPDHVHHRGADGPPGGGAYGFLRGVGAQPYRN